LNKTILAKKSGITMRWTLFIVFYILIDIYAFQAVKTLTNSNWIYFGYLILSLLVLGNFIFQWFNLAQKVNSPGEGDILWVWCSLF
jgi:hypothetical protein